MIGEVLPKQGVYRHFRDGRYYQVLWTARLEEDVEKADIDLRVCGTLEDWRSDAFSVSGGEYFVSTHGGYGHGVLPLFEARSHGPMKAGERVVVYIPLYADKPGRRIGVRPMKEFNELVGMKPCPHCGATGTEACEFDGMWTARHAKRDDSLVIPRFTYVGQEILK